MINQEYSHKESPEDIVAYPLVFKGTWKNSPCIIVLYPYEFEFDYFSVWDIVSKPDPKKLLDPKQYNLYSPEKFATLRNPSVDIASRR